MSSRRAGSPASRDDRAVHTPVLRREVVDLLRPVPGGRYVDATVGAGGHAEAILSAAGPGARLLGLDADGEILEHARARLAGYGERVVLVQENFADLLRAARWSGFDAADGVLFDLGVSSLQLDRAERGFSFQVDAPLDMRLDQRQGDTAASLLATLDERALAGLLRRYGEEPRAGAIARAIGAARRGAPIETTGQLAEIVARVVPGGRIHPATRTFQALRIAVNQELDHLASALRQAHELVQNGGRLAIISFHSLEDRIVKQYLAQQASPCSCPRDLPICVCRRRPSLELVTRKSVTPGAAEVAANPRARSARLRVAARLGPPLDPV